LARDSPAGNEVGAPPSGKVGLAPVFDGDVELIDMARGNAYLLENVSAGAGREGVAFTGPRQISQPSHLMVEMPVKSTEDIQI
jgi:hypothetical protein